ncbi:MAG: hypothetical protein IPP49_18140 [Saprospiraceae bacterium]|nr:hypothetical protein [Saprospiraceae bacterium]
MEQENKPSYNILQPLLLSACMAIGMMVGYKINEKPENTLVSTLDFPADSMMMTGRVEELIRFVENKYVEKVDGNILIDEALTAVFSKLDPHSIYLSPHEVGDVNDQMDGSYNGIGIEKFFVDDTVFVSSVLDNSPAKNPEFSHLIKSSLLTVIKFRVNPWITAASGRCSEKQTEPK